MVKKDKSTTRRIKVYGLNFLTPSLVSLLKTIPKIDLASKISINVSKIPGLDKIAGSAHPFGAIIFGSLDVVGGLSSKVRDSKFTRLAKLAGAGAYGVASVADLFSIAGGDYQSFVNLVFDASMFYSLGKDAADNYEKNSLRKDLTVWGKK